MSENWRENNSDEEDDEYDEPFGGRAGLIFTVDCAGYMFEQEGNECKFAEVLQIIEAMMRNKVVTREKDLIGVVFYNTEKSPAPENEEELPPGLVAPQQCVMYLPLGTISVEMIRKVRAMRESDDFIGFETTYGHTQYTNFSNVLWFCSRMFSHCGYKLEQSTIVLFTSNDCPHNNASQEYRQALIKAKDLHQKEILVDLVPMVTTFDYDNFYKEFLCIVQDEDMDEFIGPAYQQSKDYLLHRLFIKSYQKRTLGHLKWHLSDDISLGVNIYSLSRKPRYPKKVKLLRSTNQVIVSKRVHMSSTFSDEREEEETKALLPGEQRKSITIGGETISFKPEEIALMKQILPPGIRLLGFKPASVVSVLNHIRCSLFLFPNEDYVTGSTTLFRALYEKCIEKNQVAFCILTTRRKQSSKLVALVPEQETDSGSLDESDRKCGFRVEFIPYAADIRKIPQLDEEVPVVSNEQKELFQTLTRKIKFKFNPVDFENPVSQNLFINIESLLFDVAEVEMLDSTLPDYERIDAKLESLMADMQNLFGDDPEEAPKRRRNEDIASGRGAKISKPTPSNDEELVEMVKQGKDSILTVATLKKYLQMQRVTGLSKLSKAELVAKILEIQK